jgi:hypothetical protein
MSTGPTEDDIKKEVTRKLTNSKKPLLINSCLDLMLSQIGPSQVPTIAFDEITKMFDDYFIRDPYDPLDGYRHDDKTGNDVDTSLDDYFSLLCAIDVPIPIEKGSSKGKESVALKKPEAKSTIRSQTGEEPLGLGCCLPCSCLTLAGKRAIREFTSSSDRIRNIEYADSFYDWFLERTEIDKITIKILSDLEFGGKFPIHFDTIEGLISQVAINEINKGMSSRRKQRLAKSLKTIGMKLDGGYDGLKLSEMQIVPGMIIGLQLVAKLKDFYDFRKVVNTIEAIANVKVSAASIASILKSIELLRRASEKFEYGTNTYNTLESIVWKLFGFYLVSVTSKQIGLSQERLDDIVDAARNMLILNRTGTPSDKSRTRIYIDCANDFRDLILHILSVDETYWQDDKNLKILLDIDEPLVERFIASFKEGTGIDLADKKWLKEDPVVSYDLPNKL